MQRIIIVSAVQSLNNALKGKYLIIRTTAKIYRTFPRKYFFSDKFIDLVLVDVYSTTYRIISYNHCHNTKQKAVLNLDVLKLGFTLILITAMFAIRGALLGGQGASKRPILVSTLDSTVTPYHTCPIGTETRGCWVGLSRPAVGKVWGHPSAGWRTSYIQLREGPEAANLLTRMTLTLGGDMPIPNWET